MLHTVTVARLVVVTGRLHSTSFAHTFAPKVNKHVLMLDALEESAQRGWLLMHWPGYTD